MYTVSQFSVIQASVLGLSKQGHLQFNLSLASLLVFELESFGNTSYYRQLGHLYHYSRVIYYNRYSPPSL